MQRSFPLVIPADQPGYLALNPDFIQRYYSSAEQAPAIAPDSQYILAQKPAGSMRIVLMGGSSAAGFPYGRFGSPAAMLQQQLKLRYPQQQFEVINTAMSAVNSYTLLDITDEVIALQPDLVLIYAGHNEYLGIMGAASGRSHATTLLLLKLRKLALVQAAEQLYAWFNPAESVNHSSRTLRATMAQKQQIPFDSSLYQAGLAQFNANLRLILTQFRQAGVPVVLSTLAANEADQPPFASAALPETLQKDDVSIATLQAVIAEQPKHAMAHYTLAQRLQQSGQYRQALGHFTLASDYDALRFRAPSAINQLIRQLSTEFNLTLAEGQQQLRNASQHGIIGNSLMLEHLHPNAWGYQLLAQAFLQAITDHLPTPEASRLPLTPGLLSPLHQVDLLQAEHKIARLKADFPFSIPARSYIAPEARTVAEQLAQQFSRGGDWLQLSQALLQHYQQQQNAPAAATVAAQLADALPYRADIASLAGQLYFASQALPLAEYYQRNALRLAADDAQHYLLLSRTLYQQQDYQAALSVVEALLQRQPQHPVGLRQQAQLQQLLSRSTF